ncbi:ABC transporter permease [Bacteroides ihuae]|uniref:ABC transporter permease n=1 Tax=Bacteroides ihuae TaxID=1852362 RepID=UPI0008DAB034|nr:ABC transporter permease [Bacteroides ihuae]
MIKLYFKQALTLLRENKLMSFISIAGTALAIAIIMVIIIILRAKTANYEPELNRDRTLYVKWASAVSKVNEDERNYSCLSLYDIQQAFYPLTTPEAVTAVYTYGRMLSSVPGTDEEINCEVLYTDDAFWRMFEFGFLAGKPYDAAAFKSGLKQAVICESAARKLFGGVKEAIGRRLDLNFVAFTVSGVVRDVSKFAEQSYAEIWLPYTTNSNICSISIAGWGEGHTGDFQCFLLARNADDFSKIRSELASSIAKMNANSKEYKLDIMDQPDDFFTQMLHKFSNGGTPPAKVVIRYCVIIFIILIVPAINLSGLTQSRMRKRISELGVRKAFGATKWSLLWQVLSENFLLTLIGGLFGLLFAYIGIWILSAWLLASDLGGEAAMNGTMISLWIFLVALIFCLVLNLLSAGIPAWKAARTTIVNALNERN